MLAAIIGDIAAVLRKLYGIPRNIAETARNMIDDEMNKILENFIPCYNIKSNGACVTPCFICFPE